MPYTGPDDCPACRHAAPAFMATHAAFSYASWMTQLIPAAKFAGHWSLFSALARLAIPGVQRAERPDYLVAIPLHPHRLRERGYNQSAEIAQVWARALGIPMRSDLLLRGRDTPHQTGADITLRMRNMRRAFSAPEGADPLARGMHIALVDDVMTSGSTLNAAARSLKALGARRVDAWVLARTL